jgi:hypothetical protein
VPHLPPDLGGTQPPRNKPPLPAPKPEQGEKKGTLAIKGKRLSITDWHVEPAEVVKQLFGKEAEIDEYTGQLVVQSKPPAGPPGFPGWPGHPHHP